MYKMEPSLPLVCVAHISIVEKIRTFGACFRRCLRRLHACALVRQSLLDMVRHPREDAAWDLSILKVPKAQ